VKDLNYKKLIELSKDAKGKNREDNRAKIIKMMENAEVLKSTQNRY